MCVFRNMIVRSGVFVKSLMNIRTNKKDPLKGSFLLVQVTFCELAVDAGRLREHYFDNRKSEKEK